jgi:hypothetical protein
MMTGAALLAVIAVLGGCPNIFSALGGGGSGGGGGSSGGGTPAAAEKSIKAYSAAVPGGKLIWGFGTTETEAVSKAKAAYTPANEHWYAVSYTKTSSIVDKGKITVNSDKTITCTSSINTGVTYKLTGWNGTTCSGINQTSLTFGGDTYTILAPVSADEKITPSTAEEVNNVLTGGGLGAGDTLNLSNAGGAVTLNDDAAISGGTIQGGTINSSEKDVTISGDTTLDGTTLNVTGDGSGSGGSTLTVEDGATLDVGSGSTVTFDDNAKLAGAGSIVVEEGGELKDNNNLATGVWSDEDSSIVIKYPGKAYNMIPDLSDNNTPKSRVSIGPANSGNGNSPFDQPFRLILSNNSQVTLKQNGYIVSGTVSIPVLTGSYNNSVFWFSLNVGDTLTGADTGAVIKLPAGAQLGFATANLSGYISNSGDYSFSTNGNKSFIPTTSDMKLTWVPASGKWTLGTDT